MDLRAVLLAPLILVAATGPDQFTSGDWLGQPNYDDEGYFSDCTISGPEVDGAQLGFVMTEDGDIGLLIADDTLALNVGRRMAVLLLVDGHEPVAVAGEVVDENGLLVPLPDSDDVLEALLAEKPLRVSTELKEFSFNPKDTRAALDALAQCVESHEGTSRIEL